MGGRGAVEGRVLTDTMEVFVSGAFAAGDWVQPDTLLFVRHLQLSAISNCRQAAVSWPEARR